MHDIDLTQWLFPHESVRPKQKELIETVISCLENKTHAIIHAPTGLGKTASTLAPALGYALNHKKIVFFLTSRHTQHHIVIDTLKKIKTKYGIPFLVADLIGKKWMCLQPNVITLMSNDFTDYCKALREQNKCHYYTRARDGQKLTPRAAALIDDSALMPLHLDEIMESCRKEEVCPYEIALGQGAQATVIVADYNYIFNPSIRKSFLSKIKKELEDCIIIIDEGHNLPLRMRELLTHRLSTITLQKAVREAKKYRCDDALPLLEQLHGLLIQIADHNEENLIARDTFFTAVNRIMEYDSLIDLFMSYADTVRTEQRTSALGSIASFLDGWPHGDNGFARIMTRTKGRTGDPVFTLSKRCLDPSLVTQEPISTSYCTLMMSGTMTPTSMYRELLGFPEKTVEHVFSSPFPPTNRLILLVPETTTKFSARSSEMYKQMASYCASITNNVPGNSALFFPSYALRDEVAAFFVKLCTKTVFFESAQMQKHEKQDLLRRFSDYYRVGAVLLGVTSGNFAEGVDLPGILKCVIIAGLPLQRQDLEMNQLIAYYEQRFKKGWDYGYIFPAFSRCIQGAGRVIRSEQDRGVLIFLDERFALPHYRKYFPADWQTIITKNVTSHLASFFAKE